jgi:signal peptidase II
MHIVWISLCLVLLDQGTKLYVKGFSFFGIEWNGFPLYTSVPLIGDFLRFTYIENAGLAFGIDVGAKLFFSLFSVVASGAIMFYIYIIRHQTLMQRLPFAFILGGATGNLIDRVFYAHLYHDGKLFFGSVVDFIDVDFFDVNLLGYQLHRWPVFNIADASVSIGVCFLLFIQWKYMHNDTPIASAPPLPPSENPTP